MDKGLKRYSPFCRSRLRSWLIVTGVILGILGYSRPQLLNYAIGAVMIAPGVLLHFFCKANLIQNKFLTRSGPYRWVRHPFYLANALIDFGFCFLIGRWDVAVIFGFCWIVAYTRKIRQEEKKLAGLFGEEFNQYTKEVPALLPWKVFPCKKTGETNFTLKNPNIDTGKEGSRILRYASYPYLFFSTALIGEYGVKVFIENSSWALIPPAVFFSLCWLSVVARDFVRGKDSAIAALMESGSFRLILNTVLLGILIFTEGIIPEINGQPFLFATFLVIAVLLIPSITVLLESRGMAWFSYRYQVLFEMFFLIGLCSLGGLFYLSAVPVFFYVPPFIFGAKELLERRALSTPIVTFDLPDIRLTPYKLFKGAVLAVGFGILFVQEIFHVHYASFF